MGPGTIPVELQRINPSPFFFRASHSSVGTRSGVLAVAFQPFPLLSGTSLMIRLDLQDKATSGAS